MLTLAEYLQDVENYRKDSNHSDLRYGQACVNVLCVIRPDLYNEVIHSANDPFYNDAIVRPFMQYISTRW